MEISGVIDALRNDENFNQAVGISICAEPVEYPL
jgi:hypothetical protein